MFPVLFVSMIFVLSFWALTERYQTFHLFQCLATGNLCEREIALGEFRCLSIPQILFLCSSKAHLKLTLSFYSLSVYLGITIDFLINWDDFFSLSVFCFFSKLKYLENWVFVLLICIIEADKCEINGQKETFQMDNLDFYHLLIMESKPAV